MSRRRLRLSKLSRCFQGIVPSLIATASRDGTPNITYLSHVHYLDDQHIALSRQFFNKTQRNLLENPQASIQLHDALTFEAYRLVVRYQRSETSGPLFDELSARIDAIASHSGMTGIFRLVAADICEVISVEPIEDFLLPGEEERMSLFDLGFANGPLTEVRALQLVSERINRAHSLEELFSTTLAAFEQLFGLRHTMVLVPDDSGQRLVMLHSNGYDASSTFAEIPLGQGLIGTVAQTRRLLRMSGLGNELSYGRAIRTRALEEHGPDSVRPEVPLPGLRDAPGAAGAADAAGHGADRRARLREHRQPRLRRVARVVPAGTGQPDRDRLRSPARRGRGAGARRRGDPTALAPAAASGQEALVRVLPQRRLRVRGRRLPGAQRARQDPLEAPERIPKAGPHTSSATASSGSIPRSACLP
jgi:hypothetical protein